MKTLALTAVLLIAAFLSRAAPAATSANASSPLGVNLNGLSYYDSESPFLNIFKTTAINQNNPTAWSTRSKSNDETNEEAYLQLDSNGYPTTMTASSADPTSPQKFDRVCAMILMLPPSDGGTGLRYLPGQYVILYDGNGTLGVGNDGAMVSTSAGRDVFNVSTPSQNGVWICITSTDPSNHLRNIRVVKAEDESLLDQGNIYTPTFLGLLKNFRVIRAMQWLKIDATPTPPGNWADRPQLTDAGWGSNDGAPVEAVISLCNALSADCWINVPHTADDNYITQMATLVHQQLGSTQKVYVEFSNEVWNGGYPQYHYAIDQGDALWPNSTNQFLNNRNWYGMKTAQMCDIWAQVWGSDFSRVHCVLAAQFDNIGTATESLNCTLWTSGAPCYKHHVTDVAVAPYVGWSAQQAPTSWATLDATTLVDDIFTEFNAGKTVGFITIAWNGFSGGMLLGVSNGEAQEQQALIPYHLPMIAYEGGQSILGSPIYPEGSTIVNAYIAANRDPRMAAVYATLLDDWKANGGQMYVIYDDINGPSQYGEWGLLESFLDTVSPLSGAPPKWQAVQKFIQNNPCWWSGCAGTVAATPLAPAGFKASQ
ncbi:MAG: hypothetical protein ACREV7_16865 [Steroidobacteraceae bacterium]